MLYLSFSLRNTELNSLSSLAMVVHHEMDYLSSIGVWNGSLRNFCGIIISNIYTNPHNTLKNIHALHHQRSFC